MKIAFINIYQGKVNRGAETFVQEMSKRLSKNHRVEILTSTNVFRLLKEKYDIVIPTNGRLQAIVVRKIVWLYGGKVVISGQSGIGFDDRLNLYTFPDSFVALTDYQLNWAKKVNPFVKVVKIPNGVDLNRYSMKKSSSERKKNILAVGAFTKEKRHELTIRAVAKLENTKLIVVGGGGDRKEEINRLGSRLLGDRFEILNVSNEKMPGIYRKAGVFVYPTVPWESFGIAILEAIASGLPVVATDDPIRREIVGDAGLFVEPTDTDAYAEALKKALGINWGDKPRKQAEKFDWDKIALEYENLFKELTK